MQFYPRSQKKNELSKALARAPVVGLLGPRQCGKTTLSREFIDNPDYFFDLESTIDLNRLQRDPQGILGNAKGLVIIDEVQHMPEIFPLLRHLVDQPSNRAEFLLLGSASPELINKSGESLAGRITYVELGPLQMDEVGTIRQDELLLKGGFPNSFLAPTIEESFIWRETFLDSYLGQDLPQFSNGKLRRAEIYKLLTILADSHSQVVNFSSLASLISRDIKTVQNYIHLFEESFILRRLTPLIYNTRKRLRKAPKFYFRDCGLANCLLRIKEKNINLFPPTKMGAIWEGFAMEHVIKQFGLKERDCFYWSTQGGAEVDFVAETFNGRFGFEFKYSQSPSSTKSMHVAKEDLSLKHLYVVHAGNTEPLPFGENLTAVGLSQLDKIQL